VGFTMQNGYVPTEGSVVMPPNGGPMGQVTSARYSEQLGRVIGMAWVPAQLARDGARITVSDEDRRLEGKVQTKPFYDPDGEILRS
jgi:glycine cleavage system aminomethyltransferase T